MVLTLGIDTSENKIKWMKQMDIKIKQFFQKEEQKWDEQMNNITNVIENKINLLVTQKSDNNAVSISLATRITLLVATMTSEPTINDRKKVGKDCNKKKKDGETNTRNKHMTKQQQEKG